MPFGGFKDFKDCVSKSKGEKSPEAFCAVIMRKVEGKGMNKVKIARKK